MWKKSSSGIIFLSFNNSKNMLSLTRSAMKEDKNKKYGGGGGGGFSPDFCENTILRYEMAMMARTCTNNLRVVLSP